MIGNAISTVFAERELAVTSTTRDLSTLPPERRRSFVSFDVLTGDLTALLAGFGPGDYVVNGTGVIKQQIDDTKAADRRNAIAMNAEFPYLLAAVAELQGFRVIHIATDCVYSGRDGGYDESALHDATDVYGHSKSLGEVPSASVLNMRCSMIGRELKNKASLLEWVLDHPSGSSFSGYTDHLWNGVTARTFGKVVAGIVSSGNELSGNQHLVPSGQVTKSDLSRLILDEFGSADVEVVPRETGHPVDRTLSTAHPAENQRLWSDAGFELPPTIGEMVHDLAAQSAPASELA
jgi:dTDP-4-dehydrorhamnose reductase